MSKPIQDDTACSNSFKPIAYTTPPDGFEIDSETSETQKAYPNGIRVTFAALWQRWAFYDIDPKHKKTSPAQFAELFNLASIAKRLAKNYPGAAPSPGADINDISKQQRVLGQELWEIGSGGRYQDLPYMRLRRAAEVVQVPLGIFIFFTNLVSKERRLKKEIEAGKHISQKKKELLQLISKFERCVATARETVENAADDDDIFFDVFAKNEFEPSQKNPPLDDEEVYFANLEVLKRIKEAAKTPK